MSNNEPMKVLPVTWKRGLLRKPEEVHGLPPNTDAAPKLAGSWFSASPVHWAVEQELWLGAPGTNHKSFVMIQSNPSLLNHTGDRIIQ